MPYAVHTSDNRSKNFNNIAAARRYAQEVANRKKKQIEIDKYNLRGSLNQRTVATVKPGAKVPAVRRSPRQNSGWGFWGF